MTTKDSRRPTPRFAMIATIAVFGAAIAGISAFLIARHAATPSQPAVAGRTGDASLATSVAVATTGGRAAPPQRTSAGAAALAPCSAVPRDSFHLRLTETLASSGPAYPGGSTLTVVGPATLVRGNARLHRVRAADGVEGFAFILPGEFVGGCGPVATGASPPTTAAAPQFAADSRALLQPGEAVLSSARADLDGDGDDDEILHLERRESDDYRPTTVILAMHDARGWSRVVFYEEDAGRHWITRVSLADVATQRLLLVSIAEHDPDGGGSNSTGVYFVLVGPPGTRPSNGRDDVFHDVARRAAVVHSVGNDNGTDISVLALGQVRPTTFVARSDGRHVILTWNGSSFSQSSWRSGPGPAAATEGQNLLPR